jgi:hypothetical protein
MVAITLVDSIAAGLLKIAQTAIYNPFQHYLKGGGFIHTEISGLNRNLSMHAHQAGCDGLSDLSHEI